MQGLFNARLMGAGVAVVMSQEKSPPIRKLNSSIHTLAGAAGAVLFLIAAVMFSSERADDSVGSAETTEIAASDTSQDQTDRNAAPTTRTVVIPYTDPIILPAAVDNVDAGENSVFYAIAPPETVSELPPPQTISSARVVLPGEPVDMLPEPTIALIIDDMGLNQSALLRLLGLNAPMTVAILPYAENAASASQIASAAGLDVIVHVPMEPVGLADPGPNAMLLQLSDEALRARMRWSLARVPGAIGLNNHMGSRFTRDSHAMQVILEEASNAVPLFLDSRTSSGSHGSSIAREIGLVTLERDIFLDHVIEEDAITARLEQAESLARSRGWAVAIGHPHPQTLQVLEGWIAGARARGIQFVTVRGMVERINLSTPDSTVSASLVK
jgi:polysaccharide deacetylase 2 family uncharacterized protein YibQ